jgi:hypothetical protein
LSTFRRTLRRWKSSKGWEMCTSLSHADAAVIRKWARTYRYRWLAWGGLAVLAVVSGCGGLWNLTATISDGRTIGLTVLDTLCPSSPRVEPLAGYQLLAMASASYIMLGTCLFCIVIMFFIRRDTRRYQVVTKLLSRTEKSVQGKEKD